MNEATQMEDATSKESEQQRRGNEHKEDSKR